MNITASIIDKVMEVYRAARVMYPSYNAPAPIVSFFRAGNTGAVATGSRAIRFNLNWFENNPSLIDLIVKHEMAHIVCSATGLGKGHNTGWKNVCISLGGDGKRTVSTDVLGFVPVKVRQRKRYVHRATCGTAVELTDVMHNKIMRTGVVRVLRRTGGKLNATTFTGQVK